MEQTNKELLIKDLAGRLPYGVKIQTDYTDTKTLEGIQFPNYIGISDGYYSLDDMECKPYLRPISSITDDEERELNGLLSEVYDFTFRMDELLEFIQMQKEIPFRYIDWFNSHHFDYRGLIPMGIALEAPEYMYNK
jgi:hypothetical protein